MKGYGKLTSEKAKVMSDTAMETLTREISSKEKHMARESIIGPTERYTMENGSEV
jgi:hypothetical protein